VDEETSIGIHLHLNMGVNRKMVFTLKDFTIQANCHKHIPPTMWPRINSCNFPAPDKNKGKKQYVKLDTESMN
jgi:hypothetical protein